MKKKLQKGEIKMGNKKKNENVVEVVLSNIKKIEYRDLVNLRDTIKEEIYRRDTRQITEDINEQLQKIYKKLHKEIKKEIEEKTR